MHYQLIRRGEKMGMTPVSTPSFVSKVLSREVTEEMIEKLSSDRDKKIA